MLALGPLESHEFADHMSESWRRTCFRVHDRGPLEVRDGSIDITGCFGRIGQVLVDAGDTGVRGPEFADERRQRLGVEAARLLVIPDCTHYAPVERPELINEAIDALVERCAAW